MNHRLHEVFVGAAVIVLVAEVIVAAYLGGGRERRAGYDVIASFSGVEGLSEGSDVRLSGVNVGEVEALRLDENLRPIAVLRIAPQVGLPADTAAAIHTDGLLGEKFIALQPGGAEEMIEPGGRVAYTQPSIVLEDLLELIVAEARARRGTGEEGAGDDAQ